VIEVSKGMPLRSLTSKCDLFLRFFD